jgi:hypothetical protein
VSPVDRAAGRSARLAEEFVERFGLDLAGLTVLTEAASGPYLATPLLAALAGAERVLAWTRDSRYARPDEVEEETRRAARAWGVGARIELTAERPDAHVAAADIITNSGFVRPIDAAMVARMKPTAVIPLMWETWEVRPDEIDLDACERAGILVLGTCESRPPCDMRGYGGSLAMKLLFELGLEGHGCRVALLGAQPTLGAPMRQALDGMGVAVQWFGERAGEGDVEPRSYDALRAFLLAEAATLDALIVAEHHDPRLLLGNAGVIACGELAAISPSLRVGVISGNVDGADLRASGLRFLPHAIQPFGHMSYQTYELGPRPVLELYAAGLKVGQEMARARLAGLDLEAATQQTVERAPAMEFA